MAHKAKPKKKTETAPETKTTLRTKTNSKRKTTQQTKSIPGTKREETAETESNQEKKINQGEKSSLSCSLTESVIRVTSNPAAKASAPHEKAQRGKAANTNPNFRIFYKPEKNRSNSDITGTRSLTTWKRSSGRSKSWAVCRRLKLSREDLELLIQSKTTPVTLCWRFSGVTSPAIFVRSQGVRVYEQSENKGKRLSRGKGFDDLEYGFGPKGPLRKRRQEIEHRGGGEVAFFRLTFDHGHVSMTQETFLEKIILSTPSGSTKALGTTILADLVVIRLLRNESHADVYLVQNPNEPSRFYHAHAFLTDLSGNWSTFSKRKMDRLRKNQGFCAETVQDGRKVMAMDIGLEANKEFCLKNMHREFPPLPATELKPPTKPKKFRISYAAVVGRGRKKQHTPSNHRAYKAWEERKGKGMGTVKPDKAPASEPKLSLPEKKIEGFRTWVGRRKMKGVSNCNRLPMVSKVIT